MRGHVTLELSIIEAAHLSDLVEQFLEVLGDPGSGNDPSEDPAVARLTPEAYRDDPEAAAEFRRLTAPDLLERRRADARLMSTTLLRDGQRLSPESIDAAEADELLTVSLDSEASGAWMRTLNALRLVLASRLGIETDDDHLDSDPRFGIYDWLGYRLDGLVRAVAS